MKLAKFITSTLAALAIFSFSAEAIERPSIDLNSIKVDVALNPTKYRSLLERYENGDNTLTPSEMATVYYGYTTTYDYNPSASYPELKQAYESKDYDKAYPLAVEALQRNPLSLDVLAMALVSADNKHGKKDSEFIQKLQNRYDKLTEIILLSGKGTMPETPIIVISESDMLALLGNVLYLTEITDRGKFGSLDVVKGRIPGGNRDIVLFFNNTLQSQYEGTNK